MAEKTSNESFLPARDLLSAVRDACDRLHIISLKRRIDICAALLEENPPIDVAILGQFKAVKSSFINSLLEKPILPTGVVPVTTVITRLQYGSVERATVTHFDWSRVEIPLEKLADFTSEAGNPGNVKNVEVVDIDVPVMADYPGLRLVDTPGMGSVFKTHMKTAQEWLPEVGTAIVAISSDRTLSSFRALLGQNIESVLGLKLAEADWRIDVGEPGHPDVGITRVFDFHFDLLWFLTPMFLFRKLFERHFLALIPRAVEMNLSRLGAQWESRINATIEEMRKQAAGYVKDEIATIEALLAGSRGRTEEIHAMIEDLRARLAGMGDEGGEK